MPPRIYGYFTGLDPSDPSLVIFKPSEALKGKRAGELELYLHSRRFGNDGSLVVAPRREFVCISTARDNTITFFNPATTSTETISRTGSPLGMAVSPDGRYVFYCEFAGTNIGIIDVNDKKRIVPSIPVGGTPGNIEISPDGRFLYVCLPNDSQIAVIDRMTGIVTKPIFFIACHWIALSPDGSQLAIASTFNSEVSIHSTVAPFPLLGGYIAPHMSCKMGSMAFTPDGKRCYAPFTDTTKLSAGMLEIDVKSHLLSRTIEFPTKLGGQGAVAAAATPDNRYVYFSLDFGPVVAFDTVTHSFLDSVAIESAKRPRLLSFGAPINGRQFPNLFITNLADNKLMVYNNYGGDQIPLSGKKPRKVIISPDARRAYVANYDSHDISIIDLILFKEVARIGVGKNPLGLAISPDSAWVYVVCSGDHTLYRINAIELTAKELANERMLATGPFDVVVAVNGQVIFVSDFNTDTVTEYSPDGRKIDTFKNMGGLTDFHNPGSMTLSPDGQQIFVCNHGSNTLTTIDIPSRSIAPFVNFVGRGPTAIAYSADSNFLFTTNTFSNSVTATDRFTGVSTELRTGKFPGSVAVRSDSREAYVINHGDTPPTITYIKINPGPPATYITNTVILGYAPGMLIESDLFTSDDV